jgi:ankyrin repeat protein
MKLPSSLLSFVALLALTCCSGASAASQESSFEANSQENISAVQISKQEMLAHQGAGHHTIHVPGKSESMLVMGIQIHVDPSGSVISATPFSGSIEFFAEAVSQVKSWKYTPFERDGVPVYAAFEEYILILPSEDLPKKHVPFPSGLTLARVQMKLERSACSDGCPAYSVEIRGDGTVTYHGERYVVVTGEHRDRISEAAVSEILDAFRKADYFSLKDEYSYTTSCFSSDSHYPSFETSLSTDNVTKSLRDCLGLHVGMPEAISDLEDTIDRVAGTEKWIKGTSNTASSLRAEGWNFKSAEASSVLARASQQGSTRLVHDLLAAGVSSAGDGDSEGNALANAAYRGDRAMVQELIQAGVSGNQPQEKNDALVAAAKSGDLLLVRMLIDYGADPASQNGDGETPLMGAASSGQPAVVAEILKYHVDIAAHDLEGRTAVHAAVDGYADDEKGVDRAAVIRMLAKAGADFDAQDDEGKTALYEAGGGDQRVTRELLKGGANPDIRDEDGETPLMKVDSEVVIKLLLEAGANPSLRDNDGQTALDRAKRSGPPDKVQILEAALKQKDKS